MKPFDFINSINYSKQDLMTGTENDALAEEAYVPFLTNKSLSFFPDTILFANEMNIHRLDKKLQYHYLLNTVRPAKRYAKWVKREDIEDIDNVKEYYGYSTDKALQVMKILTADHLHHIKQKLHRGGADDKTRESSRSKAEE